MKLTDVMFVFLPPYRHASVQDTQADKGVNPIAYGGGGGGLFGPHHQTGSQNSRTSFLCLLDTLWRNFR